MTASDPVVGGLASQSRTLGELFVRRVDRDGPRAAYREKRGGRWEATTWHTLHEQAAAVAGGLVALGLEPGDRIAIVGRTCGRWTAIDLGAQLGGLVSVGLYQQQSAEQLRYLIEHSDSRVIFVDGSAELANVLAASDGLEHVVAVVPWEPPPAEHASDDGRLVSFASLTRTGISDDERDRRLAAREADAPAIFIYTSGTTGPPKAAMISHRNILSLLARRDELLPLGPDDLSFSFLPLAHAAERVLGFYVRVECGLPTCYASSMAAVLQELQETRPTLFGAVPRIFEKAYDRVQSELTNKPAALRRLVRWAVSVGLARARRELAGEPIPRLLALEHRLADRLVLRRLRQPFGGRLEQFITGAAPLALEIIEFFWAIGLPVYEAYGMTEATVLTHANRPGQVRLGTVGRPVPPAEHRIAADGEILLRAPWVFGGYHKDPSATAETIVDGWLHTGDIGSVDSDGYLRITDRKKHLIITAGGKNLTPANIENAIKTEDPLISQVHAHGDRRPYVSALIALSPIETLAWGVERAVIDRDEARRLTAEVMQNPMARGEALEQAMARVVEHPQLTQRLRAAVARGNGKLAHVETVRRFRVLERDFSVERAELTPSLKVRRRAIEQQFAALFQRIYDDPEFGIEP